MVVIERTVPIVRCMVIMRATYRHSLEDGLDHGITSIAVSLTAGVSP